MLINVDTIILFTIYIFAVSNEIPITSVITLYYIILRYDLIPKVVVFDIQTSMEYCWSITEIRTARRAISKYVLAHAVSVNVSFINALSFVPEPNINDIYCKVIER